MRSFVSAMYRSTSARWARSSTILKSSRARAGPQMPRFAPAHFYAARGSLTCAHPIPAHAADAFPSDLEHRWEVGPYLLSTGAARMLNASEIFMSPAFGKRRHGRVASCSTAVCRGPTLVLSEDQGPHPRASYRRGVLQSSFVNYS